MAEKPRAIVSSTVLDLPEHRERVLRACLQAGFEPIMMEHGSARDATAAEASRELVDRASVYIGVLGSRYGTVPPDETRSVTEIEYDRAVEIDLPRLLFLMDFDRHVLRHADVERGAYAERVDALRKRMADDRVAGMFGSADELHNLVFKSLLEHGAARATVVELHAVADVPSLPQAYVAHPYTLLETRDLVGRQRELNLMTEWVRSGAPGGPAPLLVFEAVGGMGKSALTWKWFNDIAPQEMQPLVGRVWWSFYESDASYDNFLIRSLAYATGRSFREVEQLAVLDREEQLLRALDEQPFLIVLDGVERMLRAYGRRGSIQTLDDDGRDAAEAAPGEQEAQRRLRRTIDPRAGAFLRRLTRVRASRILISTRLMAGELQTDTGLPLPGVGHHLLEGLADDDAVRLWRELGVSGSGADLLALFHTFDNYPLLIRILAGEVARFRAAPGDFAAWREQHPDFNPFGLPLTQVRSHVLSFALRGLTDEQKRLLNTLAAFRSPVPYEVLAALTIGDGRPYGDDVQLAGDLEELEDRGLVGWDQQGNRYDQHPIVRGVAWTALDPRSQRTIHMAFDAYFASLPRSDPEKVASVDELYGPLEHYHALVELSRYDDAWELLESRLVAALMRLDEWALLGEQLEELFDRATGLPRGKLIDDLPEAALLFGLSLHFTGEIDRAIPFWHKVIAFANDHELETIGLTFLSHSLCARGQLADAVAAAERSVAIADDESTSEERLFVLGALGVVRGALGDHASADELLRKSLSLAEDEDPDVLPLLSAGAELVRNALRWGDLALARRYATEAWEQAQPRVSRAATVEAAIAQGMVELAQGDLPAAEEWLGGALHDAGGLRIPGIELLALAAYAELERRRGDLDAAAERVEDVVELAMRGPFVLALADAHLLRALVAREAGDREAAVESAQASYRAAWADGPPYAYAHGLAQASELLDALGADEPSDLEPCDASAHDRTDGGALHERIVARERAGVLERMRSPDPATRRRAVGMLGLMRDAEVSDVLVAALEDDDAGVRAAVVEELNAARLGPAEWDAVLLRASTDESAAVRLLAVDAMWQSRWMLSRFDWRLALDRGSSVQVLGARVEDEDARVRVAALRALGRLLPLPLQSASDEALAHRRETIEAALASGAILAASRDELAEVRAAAASVLTLESDARAEGRLLELVDDPAATVRAAALRALADGPLDATARARAHARLADRDAEVCAAAVQAVLRELATDGPVSIRQPRVRPVTDPALADALIRLTADESSPAATLAIQALAATRTAPAVATLVRALASEHRLVRQTAVYAAASTMDEAFVEPLLNVSTDAFDQLAPVVGQAIASLDGEDLGELLGDAFASPNAGTRRAAIETLRERPDERTLPRLLAALDDDAPGVVYAAGAALAALSTAVPSEPLLARLGSDDGTVRRTVAQLLGSLGRREAADPLAALLDDEWAGVRVVAATALTRLGDPRGPEGLLALTHHHDAGTRHDALVQLRDLDDALARERLIQLAVDEPVDGVQRAAVEAVAAADGPRERATIRRLLADDDMRRRVRVLEVLTQSLSPVDRALLTRDADGMSAFVDPRAPIGEDHVARAAESVGETPAEVQRRFESIAERIPLTLAWRAPVG